MQVPVTGRVSGDSPLTGFSWGVSNDNSSTPCQYLTLRTVSVSRARSVVDIKNIKKKFSPALNKGAGRADVEAF